MADNFRAVVKTAPTKGVDEVDYRVANQDRSSISSAGSSHESLLARNSPDIMRTSSPSQLPHVTMQTATEIPRATQETPRRTNSIASESSINLPFASSQQSIDKTDNEFDDTTSKYYSSSLVLNDSRLLSTPPHQLDTSVHALSDSKCAGGSTTIVRRSSETGQLEHFRKPNRCMSFNNTTKVAVSAQPSRRNGNSSPHHEKQKYLKSNRMSVILPGIETTV